MRMTNQNLLIHWGTQLLFVGLILLGGMPTVLAQGTGERDGVGRGGQTNGRKNWDIPLNGPLSKDDPRARLSPEWEHAKEMPLPTDSIAGVTLGNPYGSSRIEYHIDSAAEMLEPTARGEESDSQLNRAISDPFLQQGSMGSSVEYSDDDSLTNKADHTGQLEIIIGNDDRQLLSPTNFYPRSAVTKLFVRMGNGANYVCSGALISARHVLTAAHCIYSRSDGGWATRVEAVPGLDDRYQPFGSAFARTMRTYQAWTTSTDRNYDFALVTLDRPIGLATGWFGYAYYPDVDNYISRLMGYPADLDGGRRLYFDYDRIVSSTFFTVDHHIDTMGGSSGSGIYEIRNGSRYIFAVHVAGFSGSPRYNVGVRITSRRFDDLRSWIASDN